MKSKEFNKVKSASKLFFFNRNILFLLFFVLYSIQNFSQDSIPVAKDLSQENELKFQQFFFEALTQKAIGNYQKAIENLESCNQILENNTTVFFEFSKNYLQLNNYLLAKEYITRALQKDKDNFWMQKHLVSILVKQNNFKEAIKVQSNIAKLKPKEQINLVTLHLQNNDVKKAMNLINQLEKQEILPKNLKRLKEVYTKNKTTVEKKVVVKENEEDIIEKFKTDKSYTLLKEILEKYKNDTNQLLKYSKEGLALFPAQPYFYLIQGKNLNKIKDYKNALEVLMNGIDFVIEESMEADFYKEIAIAYKGLENSKEEKKYQDKYKKLKS